LEQQTSDRQKRLKPGKDAKRLAAGLALFWISMPPLMSVAEAEAEEYEMLARRTLKGYLQEFSDVVKISSRPRVEGQRRDESNELRARLGPLLERLEAEPNIDCVRFGMQVLAFGKSLYGMKRFDLAEYCFSLYLQNVRTIRANPIYSPTFTIEEETRMSVTASYGIANCQFRQCLQRDPGIVHRQSLEACVACLVRVRETMRAVKIPKLCWLVYNGTVHLEAMCAQLVAVGYAKQVVEFLSWSVLCLESNIAFNAVKYLPWRVRLYLAIAKSFEVPPTT
jgi:hypothetical protein